MRISLRMWGIEIFGLDAEGSEPIEVVECGHEDSESPSRIYLGADTSVDPEVEDYADAIVRAMSRQRQPFGFGLK